MKKWLKKVLGVEDIEKAAEEAARRVLEEEAKLAELERVREEAEAAARDALQKEEEAKLSPKDRATKKGEPWVSVLDVKVNNDNIRNGFFELDWNPLFIQQLILGGYGTPDDPEEEVVDRWFREIVTQMLIDENLDIDRGMGYINVTPINGGSKSEVS